MSKITSIMNLALSAGCCLQGHCSNSTSELFVMLDNGFSAVWPPKPSQQNYHVKH